MEKRGRPLGGLRNWGIWDTDIADGLGCRMLQRVGFTAEVAEGAERIQRKVCWLCAAGLRKELGEVDVDKRNIVGEAGFVMGHECGSPVIQPDQISAEMAVDRQNEGQLSRGEEVGKLVKPRQVQVALFPEAGHEVLEEGSDARVILLFFQIKRLSMKDRHRDSVAAGVAIHESTHEYPNGSCHSFEYSCWHSWMADRGEGLRYPTPCRETVQVVSAPAP